MQESRAQRDISGSKQRPTQSRSVGPSISDAAAAHRFPTDWRLTVRRTAREKPDVLAQWRGQTEQVCSLMIEMARVWMRLADEQECALLPSWREAPPAHEQQQQCQPAPKEESQTE